MSPTDLLFLLPGPPALSATISLLILVTLLYMAREPFHEAALALGTVLYRTFRLAGRSVGLAEERLAARNREVLLAAGREAAERVVEREFERIQTAVDRDLQGYPELHRTLSEQIQIIEEDFRGNIESPAEPPDWIKAVSAVAKLKEAAGPHVAGVLEDIHKSLQSAQKEATREYRRAAGERHRQLARMAPTWRGIERSLEKVGRGVESLVDRSKRIDRHMEDFREANQGTDRAAQTLASSSVTQFFIAGLVICIAIGGALVNFYLIARPMQEMVGGATMLGPFRMANIAAMVIIFVELSMGLFLMESLRITRLFPMISALDDRKRRWIAVVTFSFLLILAVLESMLGLMREILASQDASLIQALTGQTALETVGAGGARTIPLVVHMVLSFILPFALAFVAIPLEALIHSGRTVIGILMVGFLRLLRLALRSTGQISRSFMRIVNHVYDLVIFLPLWTEKKLGELGERSPSEPRGRPGSAGAPGGLTPSRGTPAGGD